MGSVSNIHTKNPLFGAKRCPRSETEFEDLLFFYSLFHFHCDYKEKEGGLNNVVKIIIKIIIAILTLITIKVHNKAVRKTRTELMNHTY